MQAVADDNDIDYDFAVEIARRLKDPNREYLTEEEFFSQIGLTKAELEGWEDIEFE